MEALVGMLAFHYRCDGRKNSIITPVDPFVLPLLVHIQPGDRRTRICVNLSVSYRLGHGDNLLEVLKSG